MRITEVDERVSTWEDDHPRFRVYLHRRDTQGRPVDTTTYDITDADALQAIDWAQQAAGGQHLWALALVGDGVSPAGAGLTWLVGSDAHAAGPPTAVLTRMHQRVDHPVVLGSSDRSPVVVAARLERNQDRRRTGKRLAVLLIAVTTIAFASYQVSINLAFAVFLQADRQLNAQVEELCPGSIYVPPDSRAPWWWIGASSSPEGLLIWLTAILTTILTCLAVGLYRRTPSVARPDHNLTSPG